MIIREKYSGGRTSKPSRRAGGAISINPTTPHRTGDKGGEGGDAECRTGPPLPGHLVAVQAVTTEAASPGC